MKPTKEYLAALLAGQLELHNVDGTRAWINVEALKLTFTQGLCRISYIAADNLVVGTYEFSFQPDNDNSITLATTPQFKAQLELELL